jgi:hypothetical protein
MIEIRWMKKWTNAAAMAAFALTLLAGVSCSGASEGPKKDGPDAKSAPADPSAPAAKPAGEVVTKTATIGTGLPESEVRLMFGASKNFLEKIEVGPKGAPPAQTISVNIQLSVKSPFIRIEDMNFDGYKDLQVLVSETDKMNSEKYKYWLYDAGAKKFTLAPNLEPLCNPVFDAERKEIDSVCGTEASKLTLKSYTFADGELKVVREGRVEAFYNPDFFVRVIPAAGGKAPLYFEVADNMGKVVCRTDQPPLKCAPEQMVTLFTLAEENLLPKDMLNYYTDSVLWHGQKKTRSWLLSNHASYLAKANTYDLEISHFKVTYNADKSKAMVEATVDGLLKDKHDQQHEFSVEKRFLLASPNGEWKIECEEVYQYNNVKGEPTTDACKLP